jgi:large subunit ribosomal protein L30
VSGVRIEQVRSSNGTDPKQKATLRALGLGRIGKAVERNDTPSYRASCASSRTWWR